MSTTTTFLSFLLVLVGGMANATPVRGDIGSSGLSYIQDADPFPNPYITDGLGAMWDGEWNGGLGKHKESGDWIDCVLGIPLTFIKQRGAESLLVSYEADHVYLEGAASTLGTADELYIRSFFINNPLTIEVGYLITSGKESTRGNICDTIWRNGSIGALYVDPPLGGLARTYYGGQFCNTKTFKTRSFVFSDTTKTAYMNGVVFQVDEVAAEPRNTKIDVIGDNDMGYDFGFYGEIYFIRIYNRALSADEIAANYEVDKERFGL